MPSQRILREILYFLTFHFPASVEQLQLASVTTLRHRGKHFSARTTEFSDCYYF